MRKHPDQDFRTDPAGGGGGGSTGCWYLKIENPFCTGETGDSEGNEFGIANGPNRLFHFKMKSFPVVTATANPSAPHKAVAISGYCAQIVNAAVDSRHMGAYMCSSVFGCLIY